MEKKTSHGPKQNGPKAKQAGPNGYLKKKTRGLSLNSSGTMTLKSPTQIGSTNLPLKLRLIFSSPISSLTMTAQSGHVTTMSGVFTMTSPSSNTATRKNASLLMTPSSFSTEIGSTGKNSA